MIARVLILMAVNAVFLVAVLWYMPLDGLLSARGYTQEQIAALKTTGEQAATEQTADTATSNAGNQAPSDAETQSSEPAADPAQGEDKTNAAPSSSQSEPKPQPLLATDTINVRAGPGTEHRVVGQVGKGETVTQLKPSEGDWIRIEWDDRRGWAYKPLFKPAAN